MWFPDVVVAVQEYLYEKLIIFNRPPDGAAEKSALVREVLKCLAYWSGSMADEKESAVHLASHQDSGP
jgi:hypothetical protein